MKITHEVESAIDDEREAFEREQVAEAKCDNHQRDEAYNRTSRTSDGKIMGGSSEAWAHEQADLQTVLSTDNAEKTLRNLEAREFASQGKQRNVGRAQCEIRGVHRIGVRRLPPTPPVPDVSFVIPPKAKLGKERKNSSEARFVDMKGLRNRRESLRIK